MTIITFSLFAQDVAFNKGNFKDDKLGFEKPKANIELGDKWLEKGKTQVLAMVYAANEYPSLRILFTCSEFNPNNQI